MNHNIYINEIPSAELTIYDNGTPVTVVIANGAVLQNKVPYTGATQNVNLGEYGISAGFVQLDTTPTTYTPAIGNMGWNDSEGTIDLLLKGGVVSLPLGQKQVARVVNGTGGNVLKSNYQVVKVTGAQGQRLQVNLAQANNDANSADTLGLIAENINNNNSGFIITSGLVENINTTGSLQSETWTDGNILYLSPTTPGAITNVKPQAPNHTVIVGFVVYAHANNGKIFVKVDNGYELDELHNVLINTGTLANGQVLKYNSSLQVWENNTDAAGTGTVTSITASSPLTGGTITTSGTIGIPQATSSVDGYLSSTDWTTFNNKQNALTNPVTGTGTSGQVAYWNGTTTQTGSNNLFWDNANGRLGIGTNAPASSLHIASVGTLVTGIQFNNAGSIGYVFGDGTSMSLRSGTTGIAVSSASASMTQSITSTGGFRIDLQTLTNAPLYSYFSDADTGIGRAAADTLTFFAGGERARFFSNGNLALNSTTDSGQRLQVTGDTLLKGSGNTSGTTALTVQNSDGNSMFYVQNNGGTFVQGRGASNVFFVLSSTGSNLFYVQNAGVIGFTAYTWTPESTTAAVSLTASLSRTWNIVGDKTNTSGVGSAFFVTSGFTPTSGTGVYNAQTINPTINQTGGANGITRGLYVNPTLTAAADWRSIEWSNNTGWGLYGAGTANNYLAGRLGIGSTSLTDNNLVIGRSITGSSQAGSVVVNGTIQSDVTGFSFLYGTYISVVNQTFTLPNLYHYGAIFNTKGASATITNQYGFWADQSLITATNNYGFYGNIASGTGRWNLYMNGTADNYLAGNLSIATTNTPRRLNIQVANGSTAAAIGLYTGGSLTSVIGLESSLTGDLQIASNSAIRFYSGSIIGNIVTDPTNERARLFSNGNFAIGTTTDAGFKLDVNGTARIQGALTISTGGASIAGTTSLNGASYTNGALAINPISGQTRIATLGNIEFVTNNSPGWTGQGFSCAGGNRTLTMIGSGSLNALDDSKFSFITGGANWTRTSGISRNILISDSSFAPTSGTSTYYGLELQSIINQTGGANGITRGLYVNPTLTAAADWRSIETSNNTGYALYLGGSADAFFNDATDFQFGTTTGTKIGTSTSQKLGFWNATPIVQPTTGVASATRVGGGGTTLTDTDTFDGYTLAQIVKALRNTGILA